MENLNMLSENMQMMDTEIEPPQKTRKFSFQGFQNVVKLNSRLRNFHCDKTIEGEDGGERLVGVGNSFNSEITATAAQFSTEKEINGDRGTTSTLTITHFPKITSENNNNEVGQSENEDQGVNCKITGSYSLSDGQSLENMTNGHSGKYSDQDDAAVNGGNDKRNDSDSSDMEIDDSEDEAEEKEEDEVDGQDYEGVEFRLRKSCAQLLRDSTTIGKKSLVNFDELISKNIGDNHNQPVINGGQELSSRVSTDPVSPKSGLGDEERAYKDSQLSANVQNGVPSPANSDLHPTLEKSEENETDLIEIPLAVSESLVTLAPVLLPPGSLPQFCLFCPASFRDNKDYQEHIIKCNSILSQLVNFKKRKCLVCHRCIPHFNATGLLRHAISCIILDRENRLRQEREAKIASNVSQDSKNNQELLLQSTEDNENQTDEVPDIKLSPDTLAAGQSRALRSLSNPIKKFSDEQVQVLANFFRKQKFPSLVEVQNLSKQTGLTTSQIKSWFERHRYRLYWDGTLPFTNYQRLKSSGYKELKDQEKETSYSLRSKRKRSVSVETQSTNDSYNSNRRKFNEHATKILISFFKNNMTPSTAERKALSKKTKLSTKQIKNWFMNSRTRRHIPNSQQGHTSTHGSTAGINDRRVVVKIEKYTDNYDQQDEGEEYEDGDEIEVLPVPETTFSKVSDLPQQDLEILKQEFKKNPNPSIVDTYQLSQRFGVSANAVVEWFRLRRKSHPVVRKSVDTDNDEHLSEPDTKLLTSRQKLAKLKKVTGEEITDILNDFKSPVTEILALYANADLETKSILEMECINLGEALAEANNPFSPFQISRFSAWEEDFVTGMYPERTGDQWIKEVDSFRIKLLQVWSRVIVYSQVFGITIGNAAVEIFQLTLGRNEHKDVTCDWIVPDLFKQVGMPCSKKIKEIDVRSPEDSDDDDGSSDDSSLEFD